MRVLFSLLRADVINFAACHPKQRIDARALLSAEDRGAVADGGGRPRRLTTKRRQEIADAFRRMFAQQLAGE
jgi:hypothetical protein